MVYFTPPVIQDGDHAKIPHPGHVMSDQNPYPGDIRDRQIPMGCLTPPPLGLDSDRYITEEAVKNPTCHASQISQLKWYFINQ